MSTLKDLFFGNEEEQVATATENTEKAQDTASNGMVTTDMLVGDIIMKHPLAAQFLMEVGMECIFCPASQMESLTDACAVHGIDGEEIVVALNDYLQSHNA